MSAAVTIIPPSQAGSENTISMEVIRWQSKYDAARQRVAVRENRIADLEAELELMRIEMQNVRPARGFDPIKQQRLDQLTLERVALLDENRRLRNQLAGAKPCPYEAAPAVALDWSRLPGARGVFAHGQPLRVKAVA